MALVCTVCASQLSDLDVSFLALPLRVIVGIVKVLFLFRLDFQSEYRRSSQLWNVPGKNTLQAKNCFYVNRNKFRACGFFGNTVMSSSKFGKWDINVHCENTPRLWKVAVRAFLNLADLVLLILHLCHFERYIHGTKLSKNHKTSQNSCSKWGVNNSDVTGSLSDFHSAEWSFVFKKRHFLLTW